MKPIDRAIQLLGRRELLKSLPLAALVASVSCRDKRTATKSFRMGERVTVGNLVYSVAHSTWQTHLGEGGGQRVPENRFVTVEVTVSNSGSQEVAVPLLTLVDANGKAYLESENGEGVSNWMGLLRIVKPVQALNGNLLFDVPRASYKLQLTDGAEPDEEKTAFVDIPLEMEADPVLSTPPTVQQKQ